MRLARPARVCAAVWACAALLGGCGPARKTAPEDAPSVLLVSIDTLRADRVGAYGAAFGATPTLDRLASEGLRCERAIAPAPLTLPSHATLFTGLYPPRHGVRHNGVFRLDARYTTLAERFRDAGYATGAVVGAAVLDRRYGLDQGFDHYDDAVGGRARANATGFPERDAAAVTEAALRWLADTPGPFFLFVHYYDPHASYRPPPEFAARFPKRPYEAEIAAVDASVGRLLETLRASGRGERTLVAVTSDHGESLFEHGERTHGYTLYDATLRVPLLIAGPGVPRGRTLPAVVSLASLAPTLLRLARLAPLDAPDGEDLLALLEAPAAARNEAYAETLATQLDHGWAPLHALRTAEHHYVRAPRPELYDVQRDPRELENLLGGPGQPAEALERRLAALLEDALPLRTVAVDVDTRAELRALGYVLAEGPQLETGIDPKDGLPALEDYVEARGALLSGDLARAERHARRLLAGPARAQGHAVLSGVEKQRGDVARALEHAEQAARLLPHSADLQRTLGDLHLDRGDVPRALAAYEAALAIDPGLAEAHAGSMWRARVSGEPGDAEPHAARALELLPGDLALHLRIAETWDRLGQPAAALDVYRAALRLDPASAEAQMGVAIQLTRLGRASEAEAHLAAAGPLAEEPNHRNRLAIAFASGGATERAEQLFREVLAAHPSHANARRNLAHLLRRSGREVDAARIEAEAPPARGGAGAAGAR
jgi:arylsulfatase A-like enzyme/Flp pilus assembly protein TadD